MLTCSNCGTSVREGAKFCTSCGTRLNDTVATPETTSTWMAATTTPEPTPDEGETVETATEEPVIEEPVVEEPAPASAETFSWSWGQPVVADEPLAADDEPVCLLYTSPSPRDS